MRTVPGCHVSPDPDGQEAAVLGNFTSFTDFISSASAAVRDSAAHANQGGVAQFRSRGPGWTMRAGCSTSPPSCTTTY